ncbi:uncharacterized protein LOC126285270 [Schistocerca gregaria]|uniref:uncharacterized protein LOC126285270 n=1 Tax=Schistocerca gregaria TaxID=7010 RepID=UPI00211E57D2|nr:uncharacterized protein LOC126285270 [Schistocerca gregaria]
MAVLGCDASCLLCFAGRGFPEEAELRLRASWRRRLLRLQQAAGAAAAPAQDPAAGTARGVPPVSRSRPAAPHRRRLLLRAQVCDARRPAATVLPAALERDELERGAVFLPAEEPCVHYRDADAAPPPPVDPVSLSLAFGLAQRRGVAVREESLAFGPRQLPRDGQVRRTTPDVPEEGLQAFDKQVVELRLPAPYGCARAALEAEAQEALLEAQQAEIEAAAGDEVTTAHGIPRLLTYPEAGYLPEHGRTPFFVRESGDMVRDEMAREGYFVPKDASTFAAEIALPRRPGSVFGTIKQI